MRKEDPRLLMGAANFVDDVHLDRMLHVAFVRSPHAHANIRSIDVSEALAAGAVAVFIAADLPFIDERLFIPRWHPSVKKVMPSLLATDRVRHVGELVAMVVAADRYLAEDLVPLVAVDYEELDAVATVQDAMAPTAVQLHPEWPGNVSASYRHEFGSVDSALAAAPRRLSRRFSFARQSGLPLETRGCVADFDAGRNALTVHVSTQVHYLVRTNLARILGLPDFNVRVIAEDVGGGFGSKSRPYAEEVLVAYASKVIGRPVKWIEDRLESFQATTHARGIDVDLELGYDDTGKILALNAKVLTDLGAYNFTSGIISSEVAASHLVGAYKIFDVGIDVICVGTNKTPLATYRGAGQPEATFPMECMVDLIARDIGRPSTEVRFLNLVEPTDFPYSPRAAYADPSSAFESGDFPEMLRKAIEVSGYHEAVEHSESGELVAYGMAIAMESTGLINHESAKVQVDNRGNVLVYSGLTSHGQGQMTTLGKVCAEALGVDESVVSVRLGDTQLLGFGNGTFASRGAVVGGNAVHGAAANLRKRVLGFAARLLQADESALTMRNGRIYRLDGSETSVSLGDIVRAVQPFGPFYEGTGLLEETFVFNTKGKLTFAVSMHVAKVVVDPRTGEYRPVDFVVIHDTGVMLDEKIVEGQIIGGVVDGIGGTMLAEIVYDERGQLLSGSLADYVLVTAADLPRVRMDHVSTRPTGNPLGVRGVGEGGIIAVAPAIVNAITRIVAEVNPGKENPLFSLPLKPSTVYSSLTG